MAPEGNGVDQVAVMGHAERKALVGGHEGLGVDDAGFAGCGIADMADRQVAGKALQGAFAEHIGHEAHVFVQHGLFAITGNDPGAFLATMLEGVEAKIDELGGILVAKNATDTAFVAGFIRTIVLENMRVHTSSLQYCQDASKIERHKERFLVPVLLSIQQFSEGYLQPDYRFFFNKISGIIPFNYNSHELDPYQPANTCKHLPLN